ncbi:MAG: exosortase [Pseudomonadota bacterium]
MGKAIGFPRVAQVVQLAPYGPAFIVLAGWLFLFGPVYAEFADVEWRREENGHIPFIMAICIGAAWARITGAAFDFRASWKEFVIGLLILGIGIGLFSIGRITEATLLLSFSQTIIAASLAVALFGYAGARGLWFPLLLSLYLIIWPGWMLNALTAPLKQSISDIVSSGLYLAGLPVAHSGAVITAGQYQLLVADACAGLNSLISLSAVGAVYLYAVKRKSVLANAAVMLTAIPIAILANIIRVAILVLLTYFLGYDIGQGFLHHAAGLVMFAFALLMFFGVDAVASKVIGGSS